MSLSGGHSGQLETWPQPLKEGWGCSAQRIPPHSPLALQVGQCGEEPSNPSNPHQALGGTRAEDNILQ